MTAFVLGQPSITSILSLVVPKLTCSHTPPRLRLEMPAQAFSRHSVMPAASKPRYCYLLRTKSHMTCMCSQTKLHPSPYACMQARIHAHIDMRVQACMHTYMHFRVCASSFACMMPCTHLLDRACRPQLVSTEFLKAWHNACARCHGQQLNLYAADPSAHKKKGRCWSCAHSSWDQPYD